MFLHVQSMSSSISVTIFTLILILLLLILIAFYRVIWNYLLDINFFFISHLFEDIQN